MKKTEPTIAKIRVCLEALKFWNISVASDL